MGEGEQRDIVGRLLSRISNLQAAAVTAEATRRQLHNQMVELRGNVSVQTREVQPGDAKASAASSGSWVIWASSRVCTSRNALTHRGTHCATCIAARVGHNGSLS
jgi:hypothetical protein